MCLVYAFMSAKGSVVRTVHAEWPSAKVALYVTFAVALTS